MPRNNKDFYSETRAVRVVSPEVHRGGTSYDKSSGDRIVPRDNNESGPMVTELVASQNRYSKERSVEHNNKKDRERGKTKVVRIDSSK
jgi:hypothetical protein